MKLHEEFKEYENLWEPIDKKLVEKWETLDYYRNDTRKIWYSTSVSEFRAFLKNAGNAGIKGLRLSITDGIYLAGRASDVSHNLLVSLATENYFINGDEDFEWSTCGFPDMDAFDEDNFETYMFKEDMKLTEAEAEEKDLENHMLVADCGTFEVALYNFYSKDHPECDGRRLFETSDTYFALEPLIEKLYVVSW